jgi:hypothetical protein
VTLGLPFWLAPFASPCLGCKPKAKVATFQLLDLAFHLWPTLLGFSSANNVHYEIMVKYFKPCLSSSLKNNYWFL